MPAPGNCACPSNSILPAHPTSSITYSANLPKTPATTNANANVPGSASGSSFVGATSIATPPQGGHIYATVPTTGQLIIVDSTSTAGTYPLNIPNVYRVAVNTGDTVVLAMVRNSDAVYRVIKLNTNQYPTSTAAIAALVGAPAMLRF